jgi:hypothetical protein
VRVRISRNVQCRAMLNPHPALRSTLSRREKVNQRARTSSAGAMESQ